MANMLRPNKLRSQYTPVGYISMPVSVVQDERNGNDALQSPSGVIPAKAGIQKVLDWPRLSKAWIPAFAGMTVLCKVSLTIVTFLVRNQRQQVVSKHKKIVHQNRLKEMPRHPVTSRSGFYFRNKCRRFVSGIIRRKEITMKTNIVTKIIWFAVCVTVLLSAESFVRTEESPTRSAKAPHATQ